MCHSMWPCADTQKQSRAHDLHILGAGCSHATWRSTQMIHSPGCATTGSGAAHAHCFMACARSQPAGEGMSLLADWPWAVPESRFARTVLQHMPSGHITSPCGAPCRTRCVDVCHPVTPIMAMVGGADGVCGGTGGGRHGGELGVHRLVYGVIMGLPSAAVGDAPACPETQLASGARAWTSRSFCQQDCWLPLQLRASAMSRTSWSAERQRARLMQDCNRVASGRRWQRCAIERGLKALKCGKPQPINFRRPQCA